MDDYSLKAREYFKSGFNCAQSVCLAFADDYDIDAKTLASISGPFGGGMGKLRETCGAVSGMLIIAGLQYGYNEAGNAEKKAGLYALVQKLVLEFKGEYGTFVCRELLDENKDWGLEKRVCEDFVADAAKILSNYIKNNP